MPRTPTIVLYRGCGVFPHRKQDLIFHASCLLGHNLNEMSTCYSRQEKHIDKYFFYSPMKVLIRRSSVTEVLLMNIKIYVI